MRGYAIAGVLVRSRASDVGSVADLLSKQPGVEVHHVEADAGRLVITVETSLAQDEQARFEEIRRERGVISVELVFHYTEPQTRHAGAAEGSRHTPQ